eukprot:TRINITY_DN61896_c0_g1_i1.p1 TRINITY_DN61896_c0_g1~~TRINITY_DN61896_c0_g1_i1.p1  ORF type:complete len:638 (-),score=79.73 TRINITY_DN61896_c0_g1_i1:101-1963(-)
MALGSTMYEEIGARILQTLFACALLCYFVAFTWSARHGLISLPALPFSRCRKVFARSKVSPCDDDFSLEERQACINKMQEARRRTYARSALLCTAPALSLVLLYLFFTADLKHWLSHPPVYILGLVLATWCCASHERPSPKVYVAWQVAMEAKCIHSVFSYQSAEELLFDRPLFILFHGAGALLAPHQNLSSALLAMFSVCSCQRFFALLPDSPLASERLGPDAVYSFIAQEVAVLIMIHISSVTVSSFLTNEVRATFEARSSCAAASLSLLNTWCEVVVKLDRQLRIAERAEKLSSWLLRGPKESLLGVEFPGLFEIGDDSARLREAITRSKDSQSIPSRLPVSMLDAGGLCTQVNVCHTWFYEADEAFVLVGMQHIADLSVPEDNATPGLDADGGHRLPGGEQQNAIADDVGSAVTQNDDAYVIEDDTGQENPRLPGSTEQNEARSSNSPVLTLSNLWKHEKLQQYTEATQEWQRRYKEWKKTFLKHDEGRHGASRHVFPMLGSTDEDVWLSSLYQHLIRCNSKFTSCCKMHSVLLACMDSLEVMLQNECSDWPENYQPWQCFRCGMLDHGYSMEGRSPPGHDASGCKWCKTLRQTAASCSSQDGNAKDIAVLPNMPR